MKLINELYFRNRLLTILGTIFLVLAFILTILALFNTTQVLGLNSMIKPLKFALSTMIYSYTMAYLLYYVINQKAVKWYSILATVVMLFENSVIVGQALRGNISHFNQTELVGGILYALMGVFIVWLTSATMVIAIRFIRQGSYAISAPYALSIKLGLVLFVVFSFFGGYMSAVNSHNVGGEMGQSGLPLLNWSTLFGDLRVAHFFGIHTLQLIPLLGFYIANLVVNESRAKTYIWLFTTMYVGFVCYTAWQAVMGMPLVALL